MKNAKASPWVNDVLIDEGGRACHARGMAEHLGCLGCERRECRPDQRYNQVVPKCPSNSIPPPQGTYLANVDDKGRIRIPAALRQFMDHWQDWFVNIADGDTVRIYSSERWRQVQSDLLQVGSPSDPIVGCCQMIDSAGRIMLPMDWRRAHLTAGFAVSLRWNRDHVEALPESQTKLRFAAVR